MISPDANAQCGALLQIFEATHHVVLLSGMNRSITESFTCISDASDNPSSGPFDRLLFPVDMILIGGPPYSAL